MNDLLVIEQYAHVRDHAFFIVEEGQVAAACLLQKTDAFSLFCLHPGIALQLNMEEAKNHLRKATAVDAEYGTAAPDIRRVEIALCPRPDGFWRGFGGGRIPGTGHQVAYAIWSNRNVDMCGCDDGRAH